MVENCNHRKIIELLIRKSREIIELHCDEVIDEELLARLIRKNEIQMLRVEDPGRLFQMISTESVEHLDISFSRKHDTRIPDGVCFFVMYFIVFSIHRFVYSIFETNDYLFH